MVKMYGIPNCDIIKKAITWLKNNNIPFEFHDYKREGIAVTKLKEWCGKAGWETIFNKRSSTWKEVMGAHEGLVNNQAEAINIMHHHSSIIKRPVLEVDSGIIVGFNEQEYIQHLIKK